MKSVGLLENPFHLLGATSRSSRQQINDAVMDGQLDAENTEAERRLELARETLFKPEARLEAELSFLPDCRPSIIRQVTTDLASGRPVDVVTADLDGVALCNVLLHYLPAAQYKDQTGLACRIIDELAEVDVRDLISSIEQAGQLSGFDSISRPSAKRAVEKRCAEIIDQTVMGLSVRADFPETITMIAFRDGARTSQTMPLLNAYERRVSAKMDALEAKSIEALDKLLEATSPQMLHTIEQSVEQWDRTHPVSPALSGE